jgi:hypothetical protein
VRYVIFIYIYIYDVSRLRVKTVELAVWIFPATTRIFTKDKTLSENGRGAEWHV